MQDWRFVIGRAELGERLDKLIARELGSASRATVRTLFSQGRVWLTSPDGQQRRANKGEAPVEGSTVVVLADDEDAIVPDVRALPDASTPLTVVLETDLVVVVDKPARQPSAPLEPGELGTVANALLARYPEMAGIGFGAREPGLCHRLDNDTSGLLLAARSAQAFTALTSALRDGALHKRYLLVCSSLGLADRGTIEMPLAPHPRDSRRVLACAHPRDLERNSPRAAITQYRVLKRVGSAALVEARAARAMRHQIRAHFAAIGFPIHGDKLYGSAQARDLGRHALHASMISWAGDETVPAFRVHSALPPELKALLSDPGDRADS